MTHCTIALFIANHLQDGIRTAGIIVREGVSTAGPVPNIQVLEIGTLSAKRDPSDILPFLPTFRHLFRSLPTRSADMTLKVVRIPLTDLECVTNTMVKIGGPMWYLNIKKGNWKHHCSYPIYINWFHRSRQVW